MPCYDWNRVVVVPSSHPLAGSGSLALEDVAAHPIVTYVFGFTGRSRLDEAFRSRGFEPRVVLTATDAEVIKTYVRLGLGVGIIARMAYDPAADADLTALDISHLVRPSQTRLGFRRGMYVRRFMYDFIELFAPHLSREVVERCLAAPDKEAVDSMFEGVRLPEL
jgi:LysR family cys regulon transcriptional activator